MRRDADRRKLLSRRMAIMAGGKFLLLSALAGRMYYLQVVESERYTTLAEENRINLRLLPPPRGQIVDRKGRPLAVNQQNYRVVIIPEQTPDLEATLAAIGALIDLNDGEARRILREAKRKRGFVPINVRENLSWEEVARIEVNTPDLPGVTIEVGQSRAYPLDTGMAHVVGYVAAVSEDEMDGDPLMELPDFRVGKAGVEKIYDSALRGRGGVSQVEVNAFGRVIRELSRKEGEPGVEIALAIDLELQKLVMEKLEGMSAAAVCLDVRSGEVLAMASTPGFDPNAFNRGLAAEQWRALASDPASPLVNKAIAGQYAPGSTFKVVMDLAALDAGTVTPTSRVFCTGEYELGDVVFHCWKKGGHGSLDIRGAITHSCDIFFYEAARRTGIERLGAMARRLGFGQTLGLDLPGEQGGLIPTREWKEATTGIPWQLGETVLAGIGQGYILATPLQLAVMMARVVNGGIAVRPHLGRDVVTPSSAAPRRQSDSESLEIAPAHLQLLREALTAAVNEPGGTAYRARIPDRGFEMGGKTGTAQVRRITKAEREHGIRRNEDLPWEQRDHAVFVGFAPAIAPRFAAVVVAEHGGGGAGVDAPIVRDILLAAQKGDGARLRVSERKGAPVSHAIGEAVSEGGKTVADGG